MSEARLPALAPVVPITTTPTPTPAVPMGRALLQTARPRQWVKNLLVFAAPGAAGVLTEGPTLLRAAAAFGVFCLAASGTYFLNDTVDREADRRHPVNRHRPIAAGTVAPAVAYGMAVALLAASVLGALALGPSTAACVALYVAINVAYNLRLRHEPVLDLAAVASGFVLRAIVGGLATGVRLSEWFLVVTSFASLFIVAGKREGVVAVDRARPVYPPGYLRFVRALSSGVAMAAYCLWAFDRAARSGGSVWLQLTIVPFVLAMLRYALLVESEGVEAPEEALLGDATLVTLGVIWALLFGLGVYGA
jgi:decaprenyl-phosphate phosphoribosyltransferase